MKTANMRRYFLVSGAVAGALLALRLAAVLFDTYHPAGYGGSFAGAVTGICWFASLGFFLYHLAIRSRISERQPAGGALGKKSPLLMLAGALLPVAALADIILMGLSGQFPLLLMSRQQLIFIGSTQLSLRWRLMGDLLSVLGALWFFQAAHRSRNSRIAGPVPRYVAVPATLAMLCRAIDIYSGSGANPHNETAAAAITAALLGAVVLARYSGYLATGRTGAAARNLLPVVPLGLFAAASAAPAALSLLLSGGPVRALFTTSDCLLLLCCFLSARDIYSRDPLEEQPEDIPEEPDRLERLETYLPEITPQPEDSAGEDGIPKDNAL